MSDRDLLAALKRERDPRQYNSLAWFRSRPRNSGRLYDLKQLPKLPDKES